MISLTDSQYWDHYWNNIVTFPITVDLHNDLYDQALDSLCQMYLTRGPKKFIEIGCGTSKWLIYFHQEYGYTVYDIDYSEKACCLSRENLSVAGIPGQVLCEDIFDTSMEEGTFDVLYSGGVIEHFKNPAAVLQKMASFLAPGGHMITSVPNIESIYWPLQKIIDKKTYQQHFKISIGELADYYQQVGLRLDIIRYVGSFDLFSIDWSLLRSKSKLWREIGMPLIGKINGGINVALRTFSIDFRSRLFSPFMIAIGHKP